MQIIKICSTPNYWHLIFKASFFYFLNQFKPDQKWLYPFQWLKFSLSHVRWLFLFNSSERGLVAEVDPGFQVRGGALKKIAPSGGRRENVGGISCEKSRFYAKKSYCFQLRREARTYLGYFVWKITILCQKIIFFPILGGARAGCAPPPSIRPCFHTLIWKTGGSSTSDNFMSFHEWSAVERSGTSGKT